MTTHAWLVLLLACIAANLPFVNDRILLFLRPKKGEKGMFLRVVELLFWYLLAGVVAYFVEARLGPPQGQGWEFYVATFALFVVFAYPGFVWRYLLRKNLA